MACAKKCDRCGKLYEEYNTKDSSKKFNGILFANIDYKKSYFSHGPYDLCPECMEEFVKWFDNGNS